MATHVHEAFRQLCIDDTTVQGLVDSRLTMNVAPQGQEFPYVVMTVIDDVPFHHMTAASGVAIARMQVDCYAEVHSGAHDVADAIREATDGFRGTVTANSGTMVIKSLHLEELSDNYVPAIRGDEEGTYRVSMDFMIGHAQSVPTFS